MKKFSLFLFLIIITAALTGFAGLNWWKTNTQAPSNDPTAQRFVIPKGFSASQIGNKLHDQGLIKNALAFKFYVQLVGAQTKVQAGEYDLSANLTLSELVDGLTQGPDEVWVTIPEGLRREEIVEKFVNAFDLEGNQANIFRVGFLESSETEEGYLFPDTYLFPKTAQASGVVDKMLGTFDMRTDEEIEEGIVSSGRTLKEVITLASIIERESRSNAERPIVSGILLKRLDADWPLQADASVQYAVANTRCSGKTECNWWQVLRGPDLEIDSPYNLYKRRGLPPGPIANPGLESIRAAVFPEESSYWYYLHDESGNIHYAPTLEEHNENVRKFLGK